MNSLPRITRINTDYVFLKRYYRWSLRYVAKSGNTVARPAILNFYESGHGYLTGFRGNPMGNTEFCKSVAKIRVIRVGKNIINEKFASLL